MKALVRDERGLITGFVVKTILIFAVLAFVAYEGGQILITSIHAHNAAGAGAEAGADFYFSSHNVPGTKAAVIAAVKAEDPKAKVTSVKVTQDGAVIVSTRETAPTVLVKRFSFSRDWGVLHATEEAARSG